MSPEPTLAYREPAQSPDWDDVLPLADLLAAAKFFILRKGAPHGDLVDVVLSSEVTEGQLYYRIRALNHDAAGVTCVADGTIGATGIAYDMVCRTAELTGSTARVLRYIWEVMNCHPNADAKLFTGS